MLLDALSRGIPSDGFRRYGVGGQAPPHRRTAPPPFSLASYVSVSRSVMFDSLQSHALKPARFLCPWDSPARILQWAAVSFSRGSSQPRNQTGVFIASQAGSLPLSHQGSPFMPLLCLCYFLIEALASKHIIINPEDKYPKALISSWPSPYDSLTVHAYAVSHTA